MKLKTYIINLKESVLRKEHILREISRFDFLDVEFIEALPGRQLTAEQTERLFDRSSFLKRYFRHPVPGEIGCTASHRKCYHYLLASTEPYALILEDDVSFVCPEKTERVLREGIELLEKGETDWVSFLPDVKYQAKILKKIDGFNVYRMYNGVGTYAYLINRQGARRILENSSGIKADDFLYMGKIGVRMKCICPPIAVDCSEGLIQGGQMDSTIEMERYGELDIKPGLRFRIKHKIWRLYEALLLKLGLYDYQGYDKEINYGSDEKMETNHL